MLFLLVIFIFIDLCACETEDEKEKRERYCGHKPEKWQWVEHPWYVALRLTIDDTGGSQAIFYYTGTLISNRFIVTAASTFDAEPGQPPDSWRNEQTWAALPGAYNIPHIEEYRPFGGPNGYYRNSDWEEIIRIEIHPLYEHPDFRYGVIN